MAVIVLETFINASCKRCFDLSRSIDLHVDTMTNFKEMAIAGRTSGLIGLGETVTWRARHFLLWHEMTIKITRFKSPEMFCDEMVTGPFRSLRHDHIFTPSAGGTVMTDIFHYSLPWPFFTDLPDRLIIRRHMRKLLVQRNITIKKLAEHEA